MRSNDGCAQRTGAHARPKSTSVNRGSELGIEAMKVTVRGQDNAKIGRESDHRDREKVLVHAESSLLLKP